MIRKFIAIAALCLATTMAFAPIVMAGPTPDICVLDLSQPTTVDHAITAGTSCDMLQATEVAETVLVGPPDEDEAAGPCNTMAHATLTPTGARQHFDPGRCIV